MKKLVIYLLFCVFALNVKSQSIFNTYYLADTILVKDTLSGEYSTEKQIQNFTIQSSCATPTGVMNSTIVLPPSYPWLQSNGYCNPGSYGKTGTVCWTFTPTGTSISINSGYATSGCAIVGFGPFNLYTCSPSCTFQGSGLTFNGLTSGQCYTWCMSYNGNPNSCNFIDFCPYFTQSTPLPIELVFFSGSNNGQMNSLKWATATETNCDYFIIEKTIDGNIWQNIGRVEGHGNSTETLYYIFDDINPGNGVNYYRLKQVDYNGQFKYYGIVAVTSSTLVKKVIKVTNELGQDINVNTKGFQIIYYEDGSVEKIMKY